MTESLPAAVDWEASPSDRPAYAAAVTAGQYLDGSAVADIGCGTGRALPALRQAVSDHGQVLGTEVTAQMLTQARHHSSRARAALHTADITDSRWRRHALDGIFAAG